MEFFLKLVISGLFNGAIYGLVAIGFVLIFKCSGVLNFAQGYMLLLGGYIFWTFRGALGVNLFLSLLLALPSAFIVGILIERYTLRPLIGQPILSMVTVTIFLALVIEGLVSMIWGTLSLVQVKVFPKGLLKMGQVTLTIESLFSFGLALCVMVALILYFRYSRVGLAMKGVAEGHQIMQSLGVSVKKILSITWGIAGIVAVLGGILLGNIIGFQLELSRVGLLAIPAAFIGGLESPEGAILGGVIIGLIESIVSGYLGNSAGTPAIYIVLIITMLFKPYGFFGLERIERV